MGDHKNTILAVVLSLLVVVGWQYFIGYPQMEKQRQQAELKQQEQSQVQPGATNRPGSDQPVTANGPSAEAPGVANNTAPSAQTQAASREAVIKSTPRVAVDTPRLGGSIDLKGGRIDDLTLTQYSETIDPGSRTVWTQQGSGSFGIDPPVALSYLNGHGPPLLRTIPCESRSVLSVEVEVANS